MEELYKDDKVIVSVNKDKPLGQDGITSRVYDGVMKEGDNTTDVAIKMLKEVEGDSTRIARLTPAFEQAGEETLRLAQVHPHIINMLMSGKQTDRHPAFWVLEQARGGSLERVLVEKFPEAMDDAKRLEEVKKPEWIRDAYFILLNSLSAIHAARGIDAKNAKRFDVKPSHVLFMEVRTDGTTEPRFKLTDLIPPAPVEGGSTYHFSMKPADMNRYKVNTGVSGCLDTCIRMITGRSSVFIDRDENPKDLNPVVPQKFIEAVLKYAQLHQSGSIEIPDLIRILMDEIKRQEYFRVVDDNKQLMTYRVLDPLGYLKRCAPFSREGNEVIVQVYTAQNRNGTVDETFKEYREDGEYTSPAEMQTALKELQVMKNTTLSTLEKEAAAAESHTDRKKMIGMYAKEAGDAYQKVITVIERKKSEARTRITTVVGQKYGELCQLEGTEEAQKIMQKVMQSAEAAARR